MILSNVKSFLIVALALVSSTHGFSITNTESSQKATSSAVGGNRRELFKHVASAGALSFVAAQPMVSNAAPTIYNLPSGIKYAVTKDARGQQPQKGDIVAVEYTGYLTNGQVSTCLFWSNLARSSVIISHYYSLILSVVNA